MSPVQTVIQCEIFMSIVVLKTIVSLPPDFFLFQHCRILMQIFFHVSVVEGLALLDLGVSPYSGAIFHEVGTHALF